MKRAFQIILKLPLYMLAVPIIFLIRLIRPCFLIRWGSLTSTRIGHFAGNTELYLCEKDAGINAPKQRHVDLFYVVRPICNQQMATMWKRVLHVWPSWILAPIIRINRLIPGGEVHEIGNNSQGDRDVHNLLDRFPPHLKFTHEEEALGQAGLQAMGIPPETPFVCLIVRDSAYLNAYDKYGDWRYHNYRDSDIQNYILAAEELANRGYFVIRMGVVVKEAMKTAHPRIINYASGGMRTDFMDIYLGAKCEFCISVSTGFDAVPYIFRRPVVFVNMVPLGYLFTFRQQGLCVSRHYFATAENRELTLSEIFNHRGVGFCCHTSDYASKGIELIENTPEEIRDIAVEMAERLNGTWQPREDDEALQRRFWEIFPTDSLEGTNKRPLHGEIRMRFGTHFLRNNRDWLR